MELLNKDFLYHHECWMLSAAVCGWGMGCFFNPLLMLPNLISCGTERPPAGRARIFRRQPRRNTFLVKMWGQRSGAREEDIPIVSSSSNDSRQIAHWSIFSWSWGRGVFVVVSPPCRYTENFFVFNTKGDVWTNNAAYKDCKRVLSVWSALLSVSTTKCRP